MNYAEHYERLIARAHNRTLTGYRERHHVLPRCMGGDDSPGNLVDLTPEEHYVAHQLLVKMHPGVHGLVRAAMRMSRQCTGMRAYGWLRRKHAIAMSKAMSGKPKSPETRAKLAAALMGRPRPPETRAKLSTANLGKKHSPEARTKISAALRGNQYSRGRTIPPEHREKLSLAHRGNTYNLDRILSPEHRAKLSASLRGNKRRLGHKAGPHSPDRRAKISAAMRGRKLSPERVAQMSEAMCGKKRGSFAPQHRANMSAALRASWQRKRERLAAGHSSPADSHPSA